ncbi:hypothetical protein [Elioraea sp.]|jgi:hypothetical protein|uniref:hypothetical protein n=1 Tax=Elioraea sp. TaxID=2185103 RepID=UPI003F70F622
MTRFGPEGRPARAASLPAETEAVLPERLSWPAAAAVIAVVSLGLWGVIGLGIAWLIG